MSRIVKTGTGFSVQDQNVVKLRFAGQGAGALLWDAENQKLVEEHPLHRFFPPVKPGNTGKTSWRFLLAKPGVEVTPRKRCIPAATLSNFESTLNDFMAKCASGKNKRAIQFGKTLVLPDPDKSPELYRLVGWPWKRRLVVLWGCYFHNLAPLPPGAAVQKLKQMEIPHWRTVLTWYVLIPLLALAPIVGGAIAAPNLYHMYEEWRDGSAIAHLRKAAATLAEDASKVERQTKDLGKQASDIDASAKGLKARFDADKAVPGAILSGYGESIKPHLASLTQGRNDLNAHKTKKEDLFTKLGHLRTDPHSGRIVSELAAAQRSLDNTGVGMESSLRTLESTESALLEIQKAAGSTDKLKQQLLDAQKELANVTKEFNQAAADEGKLTDSLVADFYAPKVIKGCDSALKILEKAEQMLPEKARTALPQEDSRSFADSVSSLRSKINALRTKAKSAQL